MQRSRSGLRPSRIPEGRRVRPSIVSAIDAVRGGGLPLEPAVRERLEGGLGEAFGDIRVHADASAGALARAVSARAFTVGSDMFFAAGAYQPGSRDGDRLIAHEAMHVVQQRGAPASGSLNVSAPGEALELEAQKRADAFQAEVAAHGKSVSAGEHEPTGAAGAKRASRSAVISVARAADTSSDAYLRGYNDGRAGNPAVPGPIPPDAANDYDEGYQDGAAEAENAQASLPPATAAPGTAPPSTAAPDTAAPDNTAAPAPAPIPAAATVDTTSEAYLRGYNDGRGGNPAAPGPIPPDAANDYDEGYQNGAAEAENAPFSVAPAPAAPLASAGPTPPSVFFCSKNVVAGRKHAFFRVGGGGPGNQTYELEHDEYGDHCPCGMQGIPTENYPEDRDSADATCVEAPSISATCLAQQWNAYPRGNYCARGPNSNTYARVTAEACGGTGLRPPGILPGFDDPPTMAGTASPDHYAPLQIFGCSRPISCDDTSCQQEPPPYPLSNG